MAGVAGICCWNVIRTFTGRNHAIMATLTGTDNLCMINQWINGTPYRRVMTGLANICGVYVAGALTCGPCTFMAIKTRLAGNRIMIKRGNLPVLRGMASVTGFGGDNMIGALPGCNFTVVTADTGSYSLRMINTGGRRPHGCAMACSTIITGVDVRGTFTACNNTVMTTHTGTADLGMVYLRSWYPSRYIMATITGVG